MDTTLAQLLGTPGGGAGGALPSRAAVEDAVRRVVAAGDALPSAVRARAWEALLGVPTDAGALVNLENDTAAIAAIEQDLPNQRVVRVDAERTRQELPAFKEAAMRARVVRLLTYYVKVGYTCKPAVATLSPGAAPTPPVPYLQGINEVLVPFLLLDGGALSDGHVHALFSRFVATFAPRLYIGAGVDAEFIALQCSLRLFRLLLQYHDPQLGAFLDSFDLVPELYATPWLMTLFARGNDLAAVGALWDALLAGVSSTGPGIFHAVCVAFLMSHRATALNTQTEGRNASELPLVLSKLTLTSPAHARSVFAAALDLWADTPATFRRLVESVAYSGSPLGDGGGGGTTAPPVSTALLNQLERRIAAKVSVDELLAQEGSSGAANARRVPSRAALAGDGADGGSSSTPTTPEGDAAGNRGAPDGSVLPPAPATGLARLLSPHALSPAPLKYIVIDVRPAVEHDHGGHLPTAFHLDPALLSADPEAFLGIVQGLASLRGLHLAVLGSGNLDAWYHAPVLPPPSPQKAAAGAPPRSGTSPQLAAEGTSGGGGRDSASPPPPLPSPSTPHAVDLHTEHEDEYYSGADDGVRHVVLLLLQRGFAHVSEVAGGFVALHQHQAHYLDTTLVGHTREGCMVCTAGGAARELYPRLLAAQQEAAAMAAAARERGAGSATGARTGGSSSGNRTRAPSAFPSAGTGDVVTVGSLLSFPTPSSGGSGSGSGLMSPLSSLAAAASLPSSAVAGAAVTRRVEAVASWLRTISAVPEGFDGAQSSAATASSSAGGDAGRASQQPSPVPQGQFFKQMSLDDFMSLPVGDDGGGTGGRATPQAGGVDGSSPSGGVAVAAPVALRPAQPPATAAAAPAAPSPPPPPAEPGWLVLGYDGDGLPILSETAQLELQCDAIAGGAAGGALQRAWQRSGSSGGGSTSPLRSPQASGASFSAGSPAASAAGRPGAAAAHRAKAAAVGADPDTSPYDLAVARHARLRQGGPGGQRPHQQHQQQQHANADEVLLSAATTAAHAAVSSVKAAAQRAAHALAAPQASAPGGGSGPAAPPAQHQQQQRSASTGGGGGGGAAAALKGALSPPQPTTMAATAAAARSAPHAHAQQPLRSPPPASSSSSTSSFASRLQAAIAPPPSSSSGPVAGYRPPPQRHAGESV